MQMRFAPSIIVKVTLLAAVGCVLAWGIVSRGYASFPYAPSNGLRHHWALDEASGTTATDSLGVQPGTLQGGPVWQPASGRFEGALECDGVDDRVELGTMDIPAGTGMSITVWVRPDDFDVADGRIISKAGGTQEADHYWMVSTINGTGLRFRLKAGGTTTTLATPAGQLSAGEWYHVAVTYDGSDMRIYRDGAAVASMAKTGVVDASAAVAVAMGNQPAGAGEKAFDGLIDDVRVYDRALTAQEIAAMVPPKPPFTFTLWNGNVQPHGHLGTAQIWVNIVGSISHPNDVDSLYYFLNGTGPSLLTVGPDAFRLVNDGDFTIEIDVEDLVPGANEVIISGVHFNSKRADTTVTVNYTPGVAWAPDDTLRFETAASVLDEAYVVDGHWEIVAGGARTAAGSMGYDRLLVAGQRHWNSDFEVLVPITIHDFETSFPDNGPAIGVGFGWTGHTGSGQPRLGHPYQSIGFIRGLHSSPYLQLMRNGDVGVAVVPATIHIGTRYLMRIRTETLTPTTSRTRMKVWQDGTAEPGSWQIMSDFTTRGGSILLIAHRADVTFGDAIITPLAGVIVSAGETPPAAPLTLLPNAPNPFTGGTTLHFGLADESAVTVEVFDVRGRRVYSETLQSCAPGFHGHHFDAVDRTGAPLASGVYFCRVRALGHEVTRKMVISR